MTIEKDQEAVTDEALPSGGNELFSFDPLDTISKKKRSQKLETMDCWPKVKNMLDNGVPTSQIVHFIQNVAKEYTHAKPESLRTIINQWLGKLENRNKLIDHRIPVRHLNLIASNSERIDPVDAMNVLYAIQMDRILTVYDAEKQNKKLDPENNSNIRLAKEMLTAIAEMQGDIQRFKHKGMGSGGGVPSAEKLIDGTLAQMDRVKKIYEERHGQTAANVLLDPKSRRKIFTTVQKMRRTSSPIVQDIINENTEAARGHQVIDIESFEDGGEDLSDLQSVGDTIHEE